MTWLRRPRPGKGPPAPGHVDIQALMAAVGDMHAQGISSVEMGYLQANAPKMATDKWGKPLPLSQVDQDRLDRTFALLASPHVRGRALLEAGQLIPGEVDALAATNPDVLSDLVGSTLLEMAGAPGPYAPWVEGVLSVLFQMPPAKALTDLTSVAGPTKGGAGVTAPGAPPTPVDRLEAGVRNATARR